MLKLTDLSMLTESKKSKKIVEVDRHVPYEVERIVEVPYEVIKY